MAMTDPERVRAVFLDKDGTLVHDVPYNADPDRIEFLPRVGEGLRQLQDAGYLLIVGVESDLALRSDGFPRAHSRGSRPGSTSCSCRLVL